MKNIKTPPRKNLNFLKQKKSKIFPQKKTYIKSLSATTFLSLAQLDEKIVLKLRLFFCFIFSSIIVVHNFFRNARRLLIGLSAYSKEGSCVKVTDDSKGSDYFRLFALFGSMFLLYLLNDVLRKKFDDNLSFIIFCALCVSTLFGWTIIFILFNDIFSKITPIIRRILHVFVSQDKVKNWFQNNESIGVFLDNFICIGLFTALSENFSHIMISNFWKFLNSFKKVYLHNNNPFKIKNSILLNKIEESVSAYSVLFQAVSLLPINICLFNDWFITKYIYLVAYFTTFGLCVIICVLRTHMLNVFEIQYLNDCLSLDDDKDVSSSHKKETQLDNSLRTNNNVQKTKNVFSENSIGRYLLQKPSLTRNLAFSNIFYFILNSITESLSNSFINKYANRFSDPSDSIRSLFSNLGTTDNKIADSKIRIKAVVTFAADFLSSILSVIFEILSKCFKNCDDSLLNLVSQIILSISSVGTCVLGIVCKQRKDDILSIWFVVLSVILSAVIRSIKNVFLDSIRYRIFGCILEKETEISIRALVDVYSAKTSKGILVPMYQLCLDGLIPLKRGSFQIERSNAFLILTGVSVLLSFVCSNNVQKLKRCSEEKKQPIETLTLKYCSQ